MNLENRPKKIILAIDLNAQIPKLTRKVCAVAMEVFKESAICIQPVTILNRQDRAGGKLVQNQVGDLGEATARHLEAELLRESIRGFAPPKVIFTEGRGTSRAVTALIDYAKSEKADLIALASQSKKGLKRILLGSFAETLSLASPVPLLIVKPQHSLSRGSLNRVLFPTDFTPQSKEGLQKICSAIENQDLKIILLHHFLSPFQIYGDAFQAIPFPASVLNEAIREAKRNAARWQKELADLGIKSQLVLDKRPGGTSEAILAAAEKLKVGIIAMVSQSSPAERIIVGSATRQITRESRIPVWVVHCPNAGAAETTLSLARRPKKSLLVDTGLTPDF